MAQKEITLDKIRGMFIGAFLGDALGVPHEFKCNAKTHYTGLLEHRGFLLTQYQGKKELKIGQISDDGEMTLTLLRAIVRDGTYVKNNVILDYLQWANSGGWMLGENTKKLFKGVTTLKGYTNRINNIKESSQSNGALMRCSPLALIWNNNFVIEDVSITNPNPVCYDCNIVYVAALRLALQGYDGPTIFSLTKNIAQTDEVKTVFRQIEDKTLRNIVENKGWCLNALWCSLTVLLYFHNYSDAMKWVITSQPGSDTDTNACIAGALLGAVIGFDSLNNHPVTNKNIDILLAVNNENNPTPRPRYYSVCDFFPLTERYYSLFCRFIRI